MKGIVFTEFLEMVENTWSMDMVDALIERAGVVGAYTAVGTYPHGEMRALIHALAEETGTPVSDLVRTFGKHLFVHFTQAYPRFFRGVTGSLEFLAGIEDIIHAEVRKLYPDASLPTFDIKRDPDRLVMTYFSNHPFADLAHGLIEGCADHFGDQAQVVREEPLPGSGALARFIVTRKKPS
jgi:hypothetical protein